MTALKAGCRRDREVAAFAAVGVAGGRKEGKVQAEWLHTPAHRSEEKKRRLNVWGLSAGKTSREGRSDKPGGRGTLGAEVQGDLSRLAELVLRRGKRAPWPAAGRNPSAALDTPQESDTVKPADPCGDRVETSALVLNFSRFTADLPRRLFCVCLASPALLCPPAPCAVNPNPREAERPPTQRLAAHVTVLNVTRWVRYGGRGSGKRRCC
ncbi:hypothetical protein GN956_G25664 [Arapaima gigas]